MLMIFKNKKSISIFSILAVTAALTSSALTASAEDQGQNRDKAQSSEKGKSPELALTYDSKYWGTPSKDITDSREQDDYNKSQPAIPGIEVAHSEVFGVFPGRPATAAAVPGGKGDLVDHGGQVLSEVHIYPIFWGPSSATFTQAYKDAISNFFGGIQCGAGTVRPTCGGHSDLVKQYFRGAPSKITFPRSFSDSSNPPTSSPTSTSIVAEAAKVVKTEGLTIDPLGLYMVFTSNFPSRANYCAWHSAGSYKATTTSVASWFAVAYMPYVGTMTGCSAKNLPGVTTFTTSQAVHSVINVTTHELYEAMSDSLINNRSAWYDAAGYENGDKCAWNFASTVNGYIVQSEYSNTTHNCPN
ncbi:hypothetical protein MCEMRE22_01017 [Candidatus Nanopelagicaceae bacterium]